jgi:phosphoribosyl 1,2-cyclic phosphodiesterase
MEYVKGYGYSALPDLFLVPVSSLFLFWRKYTLIQPFLAIIGLKNTCNRTRSCRFKTINLSTQYPRIRVFFFILQYMSLFTASLNSGSNGNCYYVGNTEEAVLIDVGISCRELEKRMARIGLNIQKVKAIFISHEHTDHISGVRVTSKKYKIPVYINEGTRKGGRFEPENPLLCSFAAHQPVNIGELSITPFPKRHDAADPYSFVVEGNNTVIGVLTDIGSVCEHVRSYFKQCHAAFLEANYDEDMLMNGPYPFYLKKRISGDHGHLSNTQALELFRQHKADYMSHVFLSHLSKENNSPQVAQKLFEEHAGDTQVIVASRHYESDVYEIFPDAKVAIPKKAMQTSLF